MKRVPETECYFTFSRSGGAGGQHVNKTSTKVTIHWYPAESRVLSHEERARLLSSAVFRARLTEDGAIVIHEQRARSQHANRALALEKLNKIVEGALRRRKRRVKTKPTRASKEARLQTKRKRAKRKADRRAQDD